MSKEVNIRVSADTSDAKREMNKLKQNLNKMSKQKLKVGVETETVKGLINENTSNKIDDTQNTDSSQELKSEARNLSGVLERLIKTLKYDKDSKADSSKNKKTQSEDRSGTNPNNRIDDKGNKTAKTLGDTIAKATGTIGGATSAFKYFREGAIKSQGLESDALRIFNRTGVYGNDFNRARKEAYNVGRQYGYGNQESLYTQSELLEGGFTSKDRLNEDTGSIMATSRAYGLDISELTYGYNERVKAGMFSAGNADEYTKILASSIKQNNMQGRESEQVKSLNELVDILSKGKINVSSEDFKNIAGYQSILANLAPQLKGERGARLLEQGGSFFNENDQTMMMAAGYGSDLGYGLDAMWKAKKIVEDAKRLDPEALSKVMGGLQNSLGVDNITAMHLIKNATGLSTDETEQYYTAIKNGDVKTVKQIAEDTGSDQDKLLENAQSSKAYSQELYQNEKENAQVGAGNTQNTITSPFKRAFSSLPTPMQSIGSIAGTIGLWNLGGRVAGKAINNLGGLFKGASSTANVAGASLGTGVLKNVANIGSKYGKAAGGIGLGLTALNYGIETIGHVKKGEQQEAAGSLTAGLGSVGGGLAGAKLGALAGSTILPGVGTAIGGLVGGVAGTFGGSKLGRKGGESVYNAFSKNKGKATVDTHKNKTLVGRKEQILKREEKLVDRLESGDFFKDRNTGTGREDRTLDTKKSLNTSSDYAQSRNEFAQNYATAMMSGNGAMLDVGPLVGEDNKAKIWNYFEKQGFSDAAIAGIMGNFAHESGLDPGKKQMGGGPGRGLAQWEGPRFAKLQEFAKSRGTDWSDLKTQLDFVMKELTTDFSSSWLESYKKSTDINQATLKIQNDYERPGVPQTNKRLASAKSIYSQKDRLKEQGSTVSSFAVGKDRIDRDQYAFIHKDEAILNRFEAKEYREEAKQEPPEIIPNQSTHENNNQITINLQPTINADNSEVSKEIQQMIITGIQQAMKQVRGTNNGFKLNQTYSRSPV